MHLTSHTAQIKRKAKISKDARYARVICIQSSLKNTRTPLPAMQPQGVYRVRQQQHVIGAGPVCELLWENYQLRICLSATVN